MNVEAKLGGLLLSNFLEHDQHIERLFHCDCSHSWANRRAGFCFNYGAHYSNGHLVLSNKINKPQGLGLKIKVMMFLLPHHNNVNVLIIFYFFCTRRVTQFNRNRRINEKDFVKSLILKMRMHIVRNLLSTFNS